MINPILGVLKEARLRAAPLFARWCEREQAMFCPASPATIVRFVKDHAGFGIEQLWPALQDISRLHVSMGLADPTAAAPVATAVADIAQILPPRAWPDGWKQRFKALPYDLQVFVAGHEVRRDKALRRAQNDAADARHKLARYHETQIETEGKPSDESAPQHSDS